MNINCSETLRQCTGCGVCSAVCPTEAISMGFNEDGFYVPALSSDLCVNCSKCTKVCYKFDSYLEKKRYSSLSHLNCYAAKSLDDNILKQSSSGGLSFELMRKCLEQGYQVVGCAYDKYSKMAYTTIANNVEELSAFFGSKYFQSDTESALKTIMENNDSKYAFFATPCQIYAFKKLADIGLLNSDNIYIDIFCHGCSSLNLWHSYLDYENIHNEDIRFRSKAYGWHEFAFDFISSSTRTSSFNSNPFYDIFFSMLAMNEACYSCIPRSTVGISDIKLGDYWGKKYAKDKVGVSAVVVQSLRGEILFNSIRDQIFFESTTFEDIVASQSYGKEVSIANVASNRRIVLDLLLKNTAIKTIDRKVIKMQSFKRKMKYYLKRFLKLLPNDVYFIIKLFFS